MEKINFKNVAYKLPEMFPEYKNSSRYYDEINSELEYIVLGNLCLMAFDDMDNKLDLSLAEKVVKLADDIMNDPDSDIELINLFQIEVFENLVGYRKGAILAKKLLHGKSLEYLEQTMEHYGTDKFLEEYKG